MRRAWTGLVFAAALSVPAVAGANAGGDVTKHLTEVDVYLKDASNNTRLLFLTSDTSRGGTFDRTLGQEQIANIDRSLAQADRHLAQLRSMPPRPAIDLSKVDSLSRQLLQARSLMSNLRQGTDVSRIHDTSFQLSRTLGRADADLAVIAETAGVARVDQIPITEKQPVSGRGINPLDVTSPELKGPGFDRGFDKNPFERDQRENYGVPSPSEPTPPSTPEMPRY